MIGIGAGELLLVVAIVGGVLVGFLPALWAAIDAGLKPDQAWDAAGRSRWSWILLPLLGTMACGIGGLAVAGIFLYRVRPEVVPHVSSGSSELR